MRKKTTKAKKASPKVKKNKQLTEAQWQKKVHDRIPPGTMIPDRLAAQAPA